MIVSRRDETDISLGFVLNFLGQSWSWSRLDPRIPALVLVSVSILKPESRLSLSLDSLVSVSSRESRKTIDFKKLPSLDSFEMGTQAFRTQYKINNINMILKQFVTLLVWGLD